MQVQNIVPNSFLNLGFKSLLSNDNILSFYKKFCDEITSRMWKFKRAKNSRYKDYDFLRVFFFSEIIGRSIHDTSEMLNDYFLNKRRGRLKSFIDGRKKRVVPHQTDVNKFLRRIGLKKAKNILQKCIDIQLKDALKLNIITKKINVIIDFTEHPYYGKRDDKMIKGTNRQKGTKKMRHYLGFSIHCRGTHLYAGLEHISKGQSKIPVILDFLFHLFDIGFEFNYVMMDREFYRAELIDEIKFMGGNVLIPAKLYKKIKRIIEEYLKNIGKRVRSYKFSTTPGGRHQCVQEVYLILNAKKGHTLLGVKRDFLNGKLSLEEARKLIYAIMTTQKPRGKESSWASRTSRFYKKRWLIETGFSDLNRINRRWKSNHDNVRYLDMLARMLLYNSWKMNRSLLKQCRNKKLRRGDLTLNQNQDILAKSFLSSEKKSRGVI